MQDTERDKWFQDQEKLLDDLYDDYSELLNSRLDNIDGLLQEMIDSTNTNSETINQTINESTSKVGYDLTEQMSDIWNGNTGLNKIVSDYSSNFSNTLTTTNKVIKDIYDLINKTVNKSKEEVKQNTGQTKPSTGGSSSGSSGSSSSSSNSSSSSVPSTKSKLDSLLTYKKDSYPKGKLRIDTSIVDRLKYFDRDSSFAARKRIWDGLGLGGTYTGSSSQNVRLIQILKANSYSQGGQIGDLISKTGETGFALVKKGEYILNNDQFSMLKDILDKASLISKQDINTSRITNGDVNLNVTLPNVINGEQFVQFLKSKKAQDIIMDTTLGKNSLTKYRNK